MLKQFKIGHYSDTKNGTGCSVILPPEGNICSAAVMGASPGTRELALLQPDKKIQGIHALLLTGGSAFGLNAASGIVDELEQKKMGYKTAYGVVPIVPAAVIFDLNVGDGSIRPGPTEGRFALKNSSFENFESGNIGAGTAATIGKWAGLEYAMKGGFGVSQVEHGELKACAAIVLNSVGDVISKNGQILAGAYKNGAFMALNNPQSRWGEPVVGLVENTVLCAIMTNAQINKQQAAYLAGRGHLGIAQRIQPSHTSFDGDVVFVMSTSKVSVSLDTAASVIIESVGNAIFEAVKNARSLFGIKSLNDL
jgi:L-aminopeptidase/D-esterase-like protein